MDEAAKGRVRNYSYVSCLCNWIDGMIHWNRDEGCTCRWEEGKQFNFGRGKQETCGFPKWVYEYVVWSSGERSELEYNSGSHFHIAGSWSQGDRKRPGENVAWKCRMESQPRETKATKKPNKAKDFKARSIGQFGGYWVTGMRAVSEWSEGTQMSLGWFGEGGGKENTELSCVNSHFMKSDHKGKRDQVLTGRGSRRKPTCKRRKRGRCPGRSRIQKRGERVLGTLHFVLPSWANGKIPSPTLFYYYYYYYFA